MSNKKENRAGPSAGIDTEGGGGGGGGGGGSPTLNRTFKTFFGDIDSNGKRNQGHCLCIPFPLPRKKACVGPWSVELRSSGEDYHSAKTESSELELLCQQFKRE